MYSNLGSNLNITNIEDILERKVNKLKEETKLREEELQEIHAELKKYEAALDSLRGINEGKKRGRKSSQEIDES